MAGAEAALQHLLHRARQPHLGAAADLLGALRRRRRAGRLAGAGQHVALVVDHRDVLRPQPGHRAGHQVEDRLHALAVHLASGGDEHRGLRLLPVARERLAARQHQMHPRRAHPADDADAAHQLALQRPRLGDLLLELAGGQAAAFVEQLVADRPAGGQAVARQQRPQARHLVGRHHHLGAAAAHLVGHVLAVQPVDDLAGLAGVEIGIEQPHPLVAATQRQQAEQRQHAHRHPGHRHQPGGAEGLQPLQHGAHRAVPPGRAVACGVKRSVRHAVIRDHPWLPGILPGRRVASRAYRGVKGPAVSARLGTGSCGFAREAGPEADPHGGGEAGRRLGGAILPPASPSPNERPIGASG